MHSTRTSIVCHRRRGRWRVPWLHTLATDIARGGRFNVAIAARNVGKTTKKVAANFSEAGVDISVQQMAEAVAAADVVILAVPGSHGDEGIQALAASLPDCTGKVIIDCTNRLSAFPALAMRWGFDTSGAEVLAAALSTAAAYKALKTTAHVRNPSGEQTGGAGQEGFKALALSEVDAVGFNPRFVGPTRYARDREFISGLWIPLAVPHAGSTRVDFGWQWNFALHGI